MHNFDFQDGSASCKKMRRCPLSLFFVSCSPKKNYTLMLPVCQESSFTASKTSDEKFKLTNTLFSIASMLSSKQGLS